MIKKLTLTSLMFGLLITAQAKTDLDLKEVQSKYKQAANTLFTALNNNAPQEKIERLMSKVKSL